MRSLGILPVGISHITRWPCPLIQNNQTCKINHWDTNKDAENSSKTHIKILAKKKPWGSRQDPLQKKKEKKHLPKTITKSINVKTLKKTKYIHLLTVSPLTHLCLQPSIVRHKSPNKIPDQWFSRISCFRSLMDKLNGRVNSYMLITGQKAMVGRFPKMFQTCK